VVIVKPTGVVQHDEARLATFDLHRLSGCRTVDVNEVTTGDHLGACSHTIHRLPLDLCADVGRHHPHYVPVRRTTTASVTTGGLSVFALVSFIISTKKIIRSIALLCVPCASAE